MARILKSRTYGIIIALSVLGIIITVGYVLGQAQNEREIEIEVGAKAEDPVDKLFDEAQKLRTHGKEAEALAVFEDILAKHPDTKQAPMIYLYMGSCYVDLNKLDLAVAQYKKIISEYPDFVAMPAVLIALGNAYKDSQDDRNALATYQEIIDRWPHTKNAAHAALLRGKVLYRQKRYEQAASELRRMVDDVQLKSDYWKAKLMDMMVACSLKLGKDDIAQKTIDERTVRFGLKAEDQFTLASIYLQAGQYKKAKAMLEQLIAQHPKHTNARVAQKLLENWRGGLK